MTGTEKFKDEFVIPFFLLSFGHRMREAVPCPEDCGFFSCSSGPYELKILFKDVNPHLKVFENKDFFTVLLGRPIAGEGIDENLVRDGMEKLDDEDFIRSINGEFLIFRLDRSTGRFSIINDRFTSFPLYYFHDTAGKSFYASCYFSDLWSFLKDSGELEIRPESFFEFIWFQRLLGDKTYANNVFYLPDASILDFKDNKINLRRYWKRNYTKSTLNLFLHADRMAELVKNSVRRKSSDGKKYGHFLSGGMDSRSVLAAFEKEPPVCFTATAGENRERKKAREIALAKGAEHVSLELDPEHYGKILVPSVHVIGGMYNYDHGLFYGFNDAVGKHADVCFHGHGFDYMFQGMYIPSKPLVVAGRTLYLSSMLELPEDLVSFFINNASYRIKGADIWSIVLPEKRKELEEFQRESVSSILKAGRELTDNTYDLWEYLTFHHISRHYSYPNHASIATFAEQRTVSFDNDLFDFYLSLPPEHRFQGKIEKNCLKILDPKLARIWSANTNLPVTASAWRQTLYQAAGFVKRRIIPEKEKPAWTERTWMSREHALRNQQILQNAVDELCKSDILEQINFLDIKKIKESFPRWMKGENVEGLSGDLVQTILTTGTFLKQV